MNLSLHPAVIGVVLHGSRGPQGGSRPDSDVDLSLIVEIPTLDREARARLLQDVLEMSSQAWAGPVVLDLAAVFDSRGCGFGEEFGIQVRLMQPCLKMWVRDRSVSG